MVASVSTSRTMATGETCDTGGVGSAPGRPNQLGFYGRVTCRELSGREHYTGFALDVSPVHARFRAKLERCLRLL